MCVWVCTWPQGCEMSLNDEVVVFQPQTVTPPHLGSVAIITIKLSLPPHLFLPFFWIFLLSPPYYLPPPSISVHRRSPLLFAPALHLILWSEALPTTTAPSTRQPLSLDSAPRAAFLHLPSSPWLCAPTSLYRPLPVIRSLLAPGEFAHSGSLCASVPRYKSFICVLKIYNC